MRILILLMLLGPLAGAAGAQQLSWNELANRPELWPAQCTVGTAMKFAGGLSVQAGEKVTVIDFNGQEVNLRSTNGRLSFAAEPGETDVLAVAQAAYAGLTPKQRALTYPGIVQKKELWPYKVTITRSFDLVPGKTVPVGDQVLVKDVAPGKVDVVSEKLNARFAVAVGATDLMTQARKFVEDDHAGPRLVAMQKEAEEKWLAEQKAHADEIKAKGRVALELEGKTVNVLTDKPEPLGENPRPRYIVFLRGSTTCSITRNFAPSFVQFYKANKPKHPQFEVVYLTVDSLPDTASFARELGFDWRTVSYENSYIPCVHPYIDGRMPQLIVMDRDGKVLANGIQGTAPQALQQLDALLRRPD